MGLSVELCEGERHVVLSLSGDLDAFGAPIIERALRALAVPTVSMVQVDLTGLSMADSIGLGGLLAGLRAIEAADGAFSVIADDRLRRYLVTLGLDGPLRLISSAAAA